MMKISLGPLQYYWSKQSILDFYAKAAESEIDRIYLGETVCSKRRSMSVQDWIDLAKELENFGKEVVLSTLALIESESEVSSIRSLIKGSDVLIEANDYAAVEIARSLGRSFVAGNGLNLYNIRASVTLQQAGMVVWQPPVELDKTAIADVLQAMAGNEQLSGVETELFSFGRLPLSHAARCFTARSANYPKDQCQFLCREYPEGLPMYSQENNGLFQINGIQIQSHKQCNLIPFYKEIESLGIQTMRLSATNDSIFDTAKKLKQLLTGDSPHIPVAHEEDCNGYWLGKPGMEYQNLNFY